MLYSDYPIAEQNKQPARLPVCAYCDEPTQDEFCYEINGEYYCEDCLDMHFRKAVDSIVC